MDPVTVIALLLIATVILVAAEMILPTHGLLGVGAAICASGAVVVGLMHNRWLGIGMFGGLVLAAPIVASLLLKLWENSPVGRRVTLTETMPTPEHERILPGDVGQTLSELRPMGEAEFGPVTVQVMAQRGIIPAGQRVRVVSYHDGVATVELADTLV